MKIRYNLYTPDKMYLGVFKGYSNPCLTPVGPEEGFETEADALAWFKNNRKFSAFDSCIVLKRYVYE